MTMDGRWWLGLLALLLLATPHATALTVAHTPRDHERNWKSQVFLSPKFTHTPGLVQNKFYFNIDFPRGHIALKEFDAEVIDEQGNSVPLHETYLHHWVVVRYYEPLGSSGNISRIIPARNSGVCQNHILDQYFGLGSETRWTETYIPDPYGIEVGNPAEIPDGYEEKWLLNVHAIDTRGVHDKLGCTKCRCDLYNVSKDEYGRPLTKDYVGGLYCCYDDTQCRLRKDFENVRRGLYLKYTVKWVDWHVGVVPVKIFIFDVTDTGGRILNATGPHDYVGCQVEYSVEPCAKGDMANECIDSKRTNLVIPYGGDVIYGVAHQHTGGVGATLYGQDGSVICSSVPIYGHGKQAGDEAGYIVGMTTCYPQPGSVKVLDGETLMLESNYSNSEVHTGVMGLFYILVADPRSNTSHHLVSFLFLTPQQFRILTSKEISHVWWISREAVPVYAAVALFVCVAVILSIGSAIYSLRKEDGGYQPMIMAYG